jgi:hypothetical protein
MNNDNSINIDSLHHSDISFVISFNKYTVIIQIILDNIAGIIALIATFFSTKAGSKNFIIT